MNNVNWWLMTLAFVLGLALTSVMMIRRVKLEVPIHHAVGGTGVSGGSATARLASGQVDADVETTEMPASQHVSTTKPAMFVGGKSDKEPYGAGSVRTAAGRAAPQGFTIKGNEDSMLYHTPDSPSYKQTNAEVWFQDEESALRGGFTRWDKGKAADDTARFADVPPGPYGPGSAEPTADGSAPGGWKVKGNEDSMLYHTPDSPSYRQTIAEVWFRDEKSALAAGFTPWHKARTR